jgi:hypothetical protein
VEHERLTSGYWLTNSGKRAYYYSWMKYLFLLVLIRNQFIPSDFCPFSTPLKS